MKLFSNTAFVIVLMLFINGICMAQTGPKPTKSPEEIKYFEGLNKRWNNALGTFQIQVVNSRISPQIGVEIIESIEKERKEDQIIYIPIRDHVRIMVLPYKEIQKADFVKIPHFQYVSE